MDTGITTHTSRKGFLKRAGAAIAGVLVIGGTARANSSPKQATSSVATQSALSRIRPAKGAVARKSVDLT